MKTAKPGTSDINRLVSKILDKPPVEKFEKFDYTEKIFGVDYDSFVDSNFESVDPMTTDKYEFDKIYKNYEDFKKDFPKEAKLFYGWHPKGGSFLFNRDVMGGDFDGLMVKFRNK